ncbi:MAG: hypothetical protein J6R82_02700 [Clostridia bacterium]|nr:hypothetical protein [Clostridia bacterium]
MYQNGVFETTIICIDKYENKQPLGRIYNSSCSDGEIFQSTMELLLRMESLLGEKNSPQSYSCGRVFQPAVEYPLIEKTQEELRKGQLATFSLRVLFRQNASWQGTIYWREGMQEERFRSVLELLLLIDSAMVSTKS